MKLVRLKAKEAVHKQRVYRNSLYYFHNFSANLKLFSPKKPRNILDNHIVGEESYIWGLLDIGDGVLDIRAGLALISKDPKCQILCYC